jgi:hypothetical protein
MLAPVSQSATRRGCEPFYGPKVRVDGAQDVVVAETDSELVEVAVL